MDKSARVEESVIKAGLGLATYLSLLVSCSTGGISMVFGEAGNAKS